MEEKEKLVVAQEWVKKLANGINPLNGNAVKDDDIVNNVHISRCLFYVADVLGKKIERKTRTISNAISDSLRTVPFDSSAVQKDNYNYSDAISISAFAHELESLIPEDMIALSAKAMIQWLVQEGFLLEGNPENKGRKFKIASEKGMVIGIYSEMREKEGAQFHITLYNREAQKYLLEHLEEISRIAV